MPTTTPRLRPRLRSVSKLIQHLRLLAAWFALVLAMGATPALAQFPPRPAGAVLDQAELLPPAEEAALEQRLRDYNERTGRALIVATVQSLDGQDIATYGSSLGQTWGVGGSETDQGLILLVAPNERKVRIEVGYGLEEYLPDVLASRIIRDTITPRFKAGDFAGGIRSGIDAITAQLDRSPAEAKAVAEAAAAAQAQEGGGGASIGGFLFWVFMIAVFMLLFGRRGRRGRRFSTGGLGPIILWEAARHMSGRSGGGWGGGGGFGGGGGGGFGGFGGGGFGGGGASGSW